MYMREIADAKCDSKQTFLFSYSLCNGQFVLIE